MILYEDREIEELISMARARDDAAFAEIVRRYTPMLHGVISGFSFNTMDEGELLSEEYTGEGIEVVCMADAALYANYKKYLR